MTTSQLCLIMMGIYLAPHTSKEVSAMVWMVSLIILMIENT